jgi:hypothetical protein
VRVFLLGGLAFAGGVQGVEHFYLGGREDVGGELRAAVARLDELQDDAGGLRGDRGHFHQPLSGFELAVLDPQCIRFHQPEQLLDGPAHPIPVHDAPGHGLVVDRVRRQQPPVDRLDVGRGIAFDDFDQP